MNVVVATAVAVLFGTGAHLMVRRDAVKLTAGTLLITNAAVLLLVSAGFGTNRAPLLPVPAADAVSDPLVQALALTAIVIGFGTTVLLLRIVLAVERTHDTVDMKDLVAADEQEEEEGEDQPARRDTPPAPRGEAHP